jgi:hypothetical protein
MVQQGGCHGAGMGGGLVGRLCRREFRQVRNGWRYFRLMTTLPENVVTLSTALPSP